MTLFGPNSMIELKPSPYMNIRLVYMRNAYMYGVSIHIESIMTATPYEDRLIKVTTTNGFEGYYNEYEFELYFTPHTAYYYD